MLTDNDAYQILRDGTAATYDSLLNIETTPDELVGTYACSVLNSAGQSNVEQVNIQGTYVKHAKNEAKRIRIVHVCSYR